MSNLERRLLEGFNHLSLGNVAHICEFEFVLVKKNQESLFYSRKEKTYPLLIVFQSPINQLEIKCSALKFIITS